MRLRVADQLRKAEERETSYWEEDTHLGLLLKYRCHNCGNRSTEKDNFCSYCGARMIEKGNEVQEVKDSINRED